jgi:hypothetical protein
MGQLATEYGNRRREAQQRKFPVIYILRSIYIGKFSRVVMMRRGGVVKSCPVHPHDQHHRCTARACSSSGRDACHSGCNVGPGCRSALPVAAWSLLSRNSGISDDRQHTCATGPQIGFPTTYPIVTSETRPCRALLFSRRRLARGIVVHLPVVLYLRITFVYIWPSGRQEGFCCFGRALAE